jgi:hypothetical protein
VCTRVSYFLQVRVAGAIDAPVLDVPKDVPVVLSRFPVGSGTKWQRRPASEAKSPFVVRVADRVLHLQVVVDAMKNSLNADMFNNLLALQETMSAEINQIVEAAEQVFPVAL